ncbi:MAG: tetratricopeptide repeat protein [Treponemataceae bacterium]
MTKYLPVFFIELPAHHEIALEFTKAFEKFDASIPLPFVPLKQNEKGIDEKNDISIDAVLAGFIQTFVSDRENTHFDYYRELFLAFKPNVKNEFLFDSQIAIDEYDFDYALTLLLALEGLFPEDSLVFFALAYFYEKRAVFYAQCDLQTEKQACENNAENYYTKLLSFDPPIPDAFFAAGFFYFSQRNYIKARTFFNSYINIEEKNDKNTREKKKQALSIIETINEQNLDALAYADAIKFINENENEKALSRIRDFLAENPKSWNGWFVLGWALRKLERYEDAKKAFLKALENGTETKNTYIKEAYCDICNELSICYQNLNEPDEVKRWLFSALEFDTENIKTLSNLGMVFYMEGDLESAKGFFNTVLTINEEDVLANSMLEKIEKES